MDVLQYSKFHIIKELKLGIGGGAYLITDDKEKYVIKPNRIEQGINEIVAQRFIKAIGLPSLDVKWIDKKGTIFGITKYEENLSFVNFNKLDELTREQHYQLISLLMVNMLIDNGDRFEFYFRGNEIITLDLGDAMISNKVFKLIEFPEFKNAPLYAYEDENFYIRFDSARETLIRSFASIYTVTELDDIIEKLMDKIINIDLSLLNDLFDDISYMYSESVSNVYKKIFDRVKKLCVILKGKRRRRT